MDEAVLVYLANSRGNADCQAEETLNIHWHAETPAKQLAVGILKHQSGSTAVSHKLQRPYGPRAVKLIL
jgi:hypothetical protein